MKFTVVLPWVLKSDRDSCVNSMADEFRAHLIEVDNSNKGTNLGCPASNNVGIREMQRVNADWLIVLSSSIKFRQGGLDLIRELEDHPGHNVLEGYPVYGWHCICFSRQTVEDVGLFDVNFGRYGWDDIDYSLRLQKTYNIDGRHTQLWDKVKVDAEDLGMARSIHVAGFEDPAANKIIYFQNKHGRHPGDYMADSYDHPFNDETKNWKWWPTPPDPRAMNNEVWSLL